jgi:hypothetical protein
MLLLIALACSTTPVDDAATFRGVSMGDRLEGRAGFVLDRDEAGEIDVYKRPDEELMFGSAALTVVEYHTFQGQLYQYQIGTDNSKELLGAITNVYGRPPFDTPWEWNGETTKMKFNGSLLHKGATFVVTNRALQVAADEAAATARAVREAEGELRRKEAMERAARRKAEYEAKKAAGELPSQQ